ncbi:hypothetical protein [Paraburkholderia unamae]|uniref:Uncharacterized protein n=1 Tax=Paraburkholderia unamae TaxID=219649 RepID=A0ACC6RX43_9BURK
MPQDQYARLVQELGQLLVDHIEQHHPEDGFAAIKALDIMYWALVQLGPANGLELSEEDEPRSHDEQAEDSGEVVRRTPF